MQAGSVFDSLIHISSSPWAYAVVFALSAGDVIAPILPSETLVVAAGALAASGRLRLALVLLSAAAGALIGDNVVYVIGHLLSGRVWRWLETHANAKQRLLWAEHQLETRGGTVIIAARFIPGGRTATMLAAGLLALRWRRFVVFDLVAVWVWALYGGLIGFFGGTVFENEPLVGVAFAIGLALVLGVLIELGRRLRARARARARRTDEAV